MSENDVWNTVRDVIIQTPQDDAIRVENPAWPGTPDVNYCLGGMEGWIELKWLPNWPVRDGIVKVDHFVPQQRTWLTRRSQCLGRCFVLLKVSDDWLLFQGRVAADWLGKLPRKPLITRTIMFCERRLDHDLLRRLLIK